MSAQRASETPSIANPFLAEHARTEIRLPGSPQTYEIRLPGSPQTYEIRDVLRGMGLRWDPATHAWHGRLIAAQRAFLERRYGLASRTVVPIEAFEPAPIAPATLPARPRPPTGPRGPPRDYSRTRLESRLALPEHNEDIEEFQTETRSFSVRDITAGLPDDSREEDERASERQLRELRTRVKRARAIVSSTPGLAKTLANDWLKSARFYARLRLTESQFRRGGFVAVEDSPRHAAGGDSER